MPIYEEFSQKLSTKDEYDDDYKTKYTYNTSVTMFSKTSSVSSIESKSS